ncbi:hypothetical protein, partial [Vibrio sp. 10N.222.46.A1]
METTTSHERVLDAQAYQQLEAILAQKIETERIVTQEAKRLAYGTDASFYRLVPKMVLRLKNLDEVIFTIQS